MHCPDFCSGQAIVDGDAKVRHLGGIDPRENGPDAEMRRLHERFPQYGFDAHKGYPTPQHLAALRRFGVCEAYRRSFAPVREALERA
jgi:ribonuclease HII